MRVRVTFAGRTKAVEVPENAKVLDAIKKAGLNPETVISRRGKTILLESESLKNNDMIELIKIVSGG
jgi:sulfur carrier protein ThiS